MRISKTWLHATAFSMLLVGLSIVQVSAAEHKAETTLAIATEHEAHTAVGLSAMFVVVAAMLLLRRGTNSN